MTEWNSETADWYANNYGEYATNRLAVDELNLQQDSVIIDIGCGTGSALRHASSRVTNGTLIGIDPVPRMIEIARERLIGHAAAEQIEFRVGSAENFPVDNNLADFIFAFDSMDHWQDVELSLSEIHRVLKPGGQLIIVKDAGVPDATEAGQKLPVTLNGGGFEVVKHQEINKDGVSFSIWMCDKK